MSTKTKIVVCRTSYCKVFSTIFRRVSFSKATPGYVNLPPTQFNRNASLQKTCILT